MVDRYVCVCACVKSSFFFIQIRTEHSFIQKNKSTVDILSMWKHTEKREKEKEMILGIGGIGGIIMWKYSHGEKKLWLDTFEMGCSGPWPSYQFIFAI